MGIVKYLTKSKNIAIEAILKLDKNRKICSSLF